MPRRLLALVAVLAFAAACGSGGSGGGKDKLPTVAGSFDAKPTITFPKGNPSATLQKKLLKQGTGPVVNSGDLIIVNYLGQVWRGAVFDNSYDRHVPTGFPIGTGQVIKGWDTSLVGLHAGTRALLVVPPDQGYGPNGNSQAGIKGTDTLVFVVDVLSSYPAKIGGDIHATPQKALAGLPKVTGALGKQPTVAVPKGTKLPTALHTYLLDKGTGAPVKAGLVVVQYAAVDWTGKDAGSTWKEASGAPAAAPIGDPSAPTPFDGLVGMPVGSRALVVLPAKAGSAPTTADAVVVDIIAQPPVS
jgi:peptidylprolyl isomerase